MSAVYHTPVLLKESVGMLGIRPSGIYVDATLGGGGHSRAILSELGPDGRLIVFDQDRDAMANAPSDSRVTAVRANFRFIHHFLHYKQKVQRNFLYYYIHLRCNYNNHHLNLLYLHQCHRNNRLHQPNTSNRNQNYHNHQKFV